MVRLHTTDAGDETTLRLYAAYSRLFTFDSLVLNDSKQNHTGQLVSGLDETLNQMNTWLQLQIEFTKFELFDDYLQLRCSTKNSSLQSRPLHGIHEETTHLLENFSLLHR